MRGLTGIALCVLSLGLIAGCATLPEYRINHCERPPDLGNWLDPAWERAECAELGVVYIATVACPRVQVRMLYDAAGIYAIFRIEDRLLVAKGAPQSDRISFDSCVELFLQRSGDSEYLCWELAVSGNALLYDCRDIHTGAYRKLPLEDYRKVTIVSSHPGLRAEAVDVPETWSVGIFIPFELIADYTGEAIEVENLRHERWRGNFYKCAVWANPHWLSWAELPRVDFHLPEYFGNIDFE